MRTADLLAGVRLVWALDRPDLLVLAGYSTAIVLATVITGQPWIASGMVLALALLWFGLAVFRRARAHVESVAFYEYMVANTDMSDWPVNAD